MNYIVEGDLSFTNELLKMICEEEVEEDCQLEKCLISSEPLLSTHVILQCGHKFNYTNIIEEVKRQRKPSHLETQRLSRYQIKCPYCRKVQDGILPHRRGQEKIQGINWPPSKMYLKGLCKAIFKSGPRKGTVCNKACEENYCKRHKRQKNSATANTATNTIVCQTILRYGKRKGSKCLHKCRPNRTACFRHLPKTDPKSDPKPDLVPIPEPDPESDPE